MNAVGKIIGIAALIVIIPIVDIFLVPVMLGLVLIPGITIPILATLAVVAFLHYILIKAVIDGCSKKSDE